MATPDAEAITTTTATTQQQQHYLQVYDQGLANPALLPAEVKPLYAQAMATVATAGLPLVRLFCRPMAGAAKAVYIYDGVPYCYLEAPASMVAEQLPILAKFLGNLLGAPIVACEFVDNKLDMTCYESPKRFIKISVADPKKISRLREVVLGRMVQMTGPLKVGDLEIRRAMWECDVQFYRRVCIDVGVCPFGWIRTAADAICSPCGNHIFVRRDQVEALGWQGEHARISPALRICSFDIECINADGSKGMVEGRRDPSISIAGVTYEGANCSKLIDAVCFIVRAGKEPDVAPRPHPLVPDEEKTLFRVVVCPNERTMLVTFATYIRESAKPDIMTGYNTDRFDWKFLLDRASVLNVTSSFEYLCSLAPHDPIVTKKNEFHSSAVQATDCTDYRIPGILNIDVFRYFFREKKLREYTLKYVSTTYLAKRDGRVVTKKDLPYEELPRHFHGTPEERWHLANYNVWDALLVGMLIETLRIVENYIAVARVTGVDIHELITGGQQTKVHTQLLVFARGEMLIPTRWRPPKRDEPTNAKAREDARYIGATVIEPVVGFYDVPIYTLDFSSLYPSIMIANNLSHDTHVTKPVQCAHGHCMLTSKEALLCGCVIETPFLTCAHGYSIAPPKTVKPGKRKAAKKPANPCGCSAATTLRAARFVTPAVRKGVLPRILEALLSARGAAKKQMGTADAAGDQVLVAVFDALQLALKISANSVYGFAGALNGKLPCIEVSASVTSYGRDMIDITKTLVERHFTCVRGYLSNTAVIYGDTDSVMVKSGVHDKRDAFTYGKKAERLVNTFFNMDGMGNAKRRQLLRTLCNSADQTEFSALEKEELMKRLIEILLDRPDETATAAAALHSDVRKTVLEKVAERMLLISKKRYAMMKYLSPNGKGEVWQSGIESVRRDNCVFAAQLIGTIVRSLMEVGSVQECVNIAKESLFKLTHGQVPFNQLVVTKALKDKKDYADGKQVDAAGNYAGRMPQVIVNEKRIKRGMRPYHIGDRVPYVLVQHRGQEAFGVSHIRNPKQKEIVEDPEYAQANNLLPHIGRYLEVLKKPLKRIFDTALGAGATDRWVLTSDVLTLQKAPLEKTNRFFGAFLVEKRPADDDGASAEPQEIAPKLRATAAADSERTYAGVADDQVSEWMCSAPKQKSISSFFVKK